MPPTEAYSRRQVLATAGIGLTSLAGCAGFDPLESEPDYDVGALTTLADSTPPSVPREIPVDMPGDLRETFIAAARDHVEAVPSNPDVPNQGVATRLEEERERARDSLRRDESGSGTALQRTNSGRYTLSNAAAFRGAYQAATGEIDLAAVRAQRDELRARFHDFHTSWDYRARDPLEALIVHRRIEDILEEAKRAIRPGKSLPAEPTDAPFVVGEVVGEVVRGLAAVETADRLRTVYLAGIENPTAYREAIISRANRIERWMREYRYRLADYFEEHGNREITEPHPAEYLFREAEFQQERAWDSIERARDREQFAQAVLDGGYLDATLRSSRAAIQVVRNSELPPPESASVVRTEYEDAVAAFETALGAAPEEIAPAISGMAGQYLEEGLRRLSEPDRYPRAVYMATANFRIARLYAEAVPGAARTVASWFGQEP